MRPMVVVVVFLLACEAGAAPPTLEELVAFAPAGSVTDTLSEDMRRNAMRTAAVGYAARAGLTRRGWEIARILERFAPQIGRVFRFRDLMIHEGGFLVQPPVLAETRQAFRLDRSLDRAASAGRHLKIVAGERILSGLPDWRDFLVRHWAGAEAPAAVLFPRDAAERELWRGWLEEGWKEGTDLADMIFLDDLERLTGFFEGLVLWHRLNRQRMVSAPVLSLQRSAVSGGGDVMRIDEALVTISARASFVAIPDLWRLP
ncbi:MAG: type IV secretory system conjugative DNA transfer family protein [Alphaproteobacteria bacterium]|nr:type IV secretory system conjugative DNA transfer family protein [Alphaproteobacteria bacterium]MCY4500207.1 type IV secretory system conjugative DNA transfer family protein [Alphaproteobacteria bacterium]